jgi:hypothetical protein
MRPPRIVAQLSALVLAAGTGVGVWLMVPASAEPDPALSPATLTGTATCDPATSSWQVDWTLTNQTAQPLTVGDVTAVPPAGASSVTDLAAGDTLPVDSPLTATQMVHDYGFTEATLSVSLIAPDVAADQTVTGTVTFADRCGQAVLPTVHFESMCDSLAIHLGLDAAGAPMEVDLRTTDGALIRRVALQPGAPEQTVSLAVQDDATVTLYGTTVAKGSWVLPASCTPPVIGRFGLLAHANMRYVATNDSGALIADTSWFNWIDTQYDIYDLGGGSIALRSVLNGRYVSATNGGDGSLAASASRITGATERFLMITNADGTISLRSAANGNYVTAEKAGTLPLIANRTAIGPWERFGRYGVGHGPVALDALANGKWVTAELAGTTALIANHSTVGLWQYFEIIDVGDGQVGLKTLVNGKWVCADKIGTAPLIANRDNRGLWETFDLIDNGDGTISFRAAVNGKYVTAEGAGTKPLIANRTAIGSWEKFVNPF